MDARAAGTSAASAAGSSFQNGRHRLGARLAHESRTTGQRFVEDCPDGEEVRPWVDGFAADLLGGHIAGRPHHHARLGFEIFAGTRL